MERMVRHPAYHWSSLKNDIALFRLEEPVDSQVYSPVCLPPRSADYTGQTGWVLGWGHTSEGGIQASVLQELELLVVSDATCYDKMFGQTFAAEQLCAGGEEGKDACSGDGGGPLVCPGPQQGTMVLAGLVSWGVGCGTAGVPGVYTNIAAYTGWIQETISMF